MKTLRSKLPEDEMMRKIIKQIRLAKRNSKNLIQQMNELFDETNNNIGSEGDYPASPSNK